MAKKSKYVSISLPTGISNEMDKLIDELGHWPSRGAFVREACLEKIREERRRLRSSGRPRGETTERSEP